MTVEYFTDEQWRAREAEAQRAATAAREARLDWIDALEPLRDELVVRLRAELGPDYNVPAPPRVD
ncbi:MAG TPA: hypothetical protein VMZ00_15005 [Sporichthya sp.]|nr:hypothetical protein [Sporichthya sp.]